MSEHEVERLRQVYREYEARELSTTRWGEQNRGNRAIMGERGRIMRRLLHSQGLLPLGARDVLEVGCGSGHVLAGLQELGAAPERLHGVDLLSARVARARNDHPDLDIREANAEQLPFGSQSFDLLMLFVVFSSILDGTMRHNVARECARVLRSGGHVLWYDLRYDNPSNPNVRGISSSALQRLFPDFAIRLQTLTVVPQLARRLGPLTELAYPVLAAVPPLRTYYMALLRKP